MSIKLIYFTHASSKRKFFKSISSVSPRRIDELFRRLDANDVLLVAELSRLGRNMFELLNIINQLSENGVRIVFVRQPELLLADTLNNGRLTASGY